MNRSLRTWFAVIADRLWASDPGLGRLRMALSGSIAVGSALGVEALIAHVRGLPWLSTFVSMLLGAVVAMMGSMALAGSDMLTKVRTAAFFPVAVGLGMAGGVAVGTHIDLMLAVFVVIMFVAVYVRRFGLAFFFYGFMLWMGYFFSAFLHATVDMLPILIEAVLISTAWVLLLSITVLRTNNARTLRRTLQAYRARERGVVRACADLLAAQNADERARRRARRRVRARQAGLAEAALIVEGWSEERGALPHGWSGQALRRRLLDMQHIIDRVASSATTLAAGSDAPSSNALIHAAYTATDAFALGNLREARSAAVRLAKCADGSEGSPAARQLALAAIEYLDLVERIDDPPPQASGDEFKASASLMMGNLAGAVAVARDVPARGVSWNPLARLDMTTRQAIQVAIAGGLAILCGRELSPLRYYWAVIAAFVAFTGTATRSQTALKAFNRVLGTLCGLVAAIACANATAGHSTWVVVVVLGSIFCGFYLIRISYAYMIFFITIMVGQLYSALHEFSDALLVLRLEETAIGAAIGIAVAIFVTPVSSGDTAASAERGALAALGDLLAGVAACMRDDQPLPDIDFLMRTLDNRVRELSLVSGPLKRPILWGNRAADRHRLAGFASATTHARSLVVAARSDGNGWLAHVARDTATITAVADACDALAEVATGFAAHSPDETHDPTSVANLLNKVDAALFGSQANVAQARVSAAARASSGDSIMVALLHIQGVLRGLASDAG